MVKRVLLFFPLAVSAELFTASFTAPSAAWRYGNSLQPVRDGMLQLTPREPEVTLCGTAVHPDNLEGAEAELDVLFDKPQQKHTLVWGKPFEWDRPEAGRGSLVITSNGVYRMYKGTDNLFLRRLRLSQTASPRPQTGAARFPKSSGLARSFCVRLGTVCV